MSSRPNWHGDHPSACTCWRCTGSEAPGRKPNPPRKPHNGYRWELCPTCNGKGETFGRLVMQPGGKKTRCGRCLRVGWVEVPIRRTPNKPNKGTIEPTDDESHPTETMWEWLNKPIDDEEIRGSRQDLGSDEVPQPASKSSKPPAGPSNGGKRKKKRRQNRNWYREETRRRWEATRGNPYSRRTGPGKWQTSTSSGGGRFKLFAMACLLVVPLWMWGYHENVPLAVTAWQTTSVAYHKVMSFSKEAAIDATTAISEEIRSAPDTQEASRATNSQNYAGGSPLNREEIEEWVVEFTNDERISVGLQPLRHDDAISDIALSHSKSMARLGFMSHDIEGRDPTDRAMVAGYDCRAYRGDGSYSYGLSENIAEHPRVTQWMGFGTSYSPIDYDRDAEEVARGLVQGWMSSPGHRENILDRDSRRIGVGIAIREAPEYGYVSETIYATQNFSACK